MAKKKSEPVEQPKNPKSHRSRPQRATTAERAQWAFLLYEAMGASRTLTALSDIVRLIGIRRCGLKTLERWSAKYHWQQQLVQRQAGREGLVTQMALDMKKEMEDRHIASFRMLENIARAGLENTFSELAKREAVGLKGLEIAPADAARLLETAQRGERLARGEATSKAQVVVQVVGPLVKDIFAVFMAVNVITNDPIELQRKRQAEFIKRGDEILATYYLEEGTAQ